MRTLARINRNEWVSSLLVSPNDSSLSARTQYFLAMVFDAENQTVSTLMEAITRLRPEESFADHVRDTITLLSGRCPKTSTRTGTFASYTTGWLRIDCLITAMVVAFCLPAALA
jgi:hypothetical protein